ncbi:glycosyltransferase [Aquimarina sp. RZ0]|uniref:glycosyltransferase n=1 Tax=Aquimarina sp. RZ0 TaxID=2607730 RepID=UPI0011F3A74D|nr:glycosyltransferase [Aquimarina sp. RZ0]KAA1246566.1 glycosyltransferase family 4 protein [Aquimarina sp. RZ0]
MQKTTINVYAKPGITPWLFDDLKTHFKKLKLKDIQIVTSEYPDQNADAWIAIRTAEAILAPDLEKTVACIHDLYAHDNMYQADGLRAIVKKVRGLVLCHPKQRKILYQAGIDLTEKKILERPLGALSGFSPGDKIPEKFTIAWIGRNHWRKRITWFIEAIQKLALPKNQFNIVLLGKGISESAKLLQSLGFACTAYPKDTYTIASYPELYRAMSCLVITSITEAGPLTLFESLATGNPVISTKVGWSPLIKTDAITLVDNPDEISSALLQLYRKQEDNFLKRYRISKLVTHVTLESWIEEVVQLAYSLINYKKNVSLS